MEVARHGTAYTALPAGKLQDLKQFAIHIDLTSTSDGLNAFEKIFSCFDNQEEMNFLLGQWKDGLILHLRTDKQIKGIKFGSEGVLKIGERTRCLITYDGAKLSLHQDGKVKRYRETGPLNFSNWDRTYPLIVGTDAGGRSQWKGTIYEIAVFDRPLSAREIAQLSVPSSDRSGKSDNNGKISRKENPPVSPFTKGGGLEGGPFVKGGGGKGEIAAHPAGARNDKAGIENPPPSPFIKAGSHAKSQDNRPAIHYVFKPENIYETEFRGKKAIGVRDLGKGETADLVMPEQFAPYKRVILGWDPDWTKRSSEWLDLVVNIVGFIPFGALLLLVLGNGKLGIGKKPQATSNKPQGDAAARQGFRIRDSGIRKDEENPPQSPFTKGGGLEGGPFVKGGGGKGEIAAHPSDARNDKGGQENPPVSPIGRSAAVTSGQWTVVSEGKEKKQVSNSRIVLMVVVAVVVGFGVSLAIEWLQAYLPSRDSSLRDLICNTVGTAIGACAVAWVLRSRNAAAIR